MTDNIILLDAEREAEAAIAGPPGDGPALLDEVRETIVRYVALPSPAVADAIALWITATHAQPAWDHATRLVVKSPIRRCGKTRLLEVVAGLAWQPLLSANMSVAALVRSLSPDDPPTVVLDEADAVFARRRGERSEAAEDLRGILNAGHGRGWPYVRWNAQARQAESCPTFAMAAVAAIGDLPETIEDRAVVIRMQRRAPGERVAPLRQRNLPTLHAVRVRLHAWVGGRMQHLRDADPDMPVEDRAADVWAPLIAIADGAGGEWPERARRACFAMAAVDEDAATLGECVLRDLREVFGSADRLATAEVVQRLRDIEDGPWVELNGGRGLTPHGLGRLLRPYGIRSKTVRLAGGETPKGYVRDDFLTTWDRYLGAPPPQSATPPQGAIGESETGQEGVAFRDLQNATETPQGGGASSESENESNERGCGGVADVADARAGDEEEPLPPSTHPLVRAAIEHNRRWRRERRAKEAIKWEL